MANIYTCYPPSKHINLRILSIRPHMKTNNNSNINYPYRQHYIFLKVLTAFKNNSLRISSIFLLLSSERKKLYLLYSNTKLFQLYARCCYIVYAFSRSMLRCIFVYLFTCIISQNKHEYIQIWIAVYQMFQLWIKTIHFLWIWRINIINLLSLLCYAKK